MREVTVRVRHHGAPESDVSARHPDVTLRSVSSMTGSAHKRKRIIELSGPATAIEAFLQEFRDADPILAAEPLSPLDASRVFATFSYNADRWDSISQRLADSSVHYRTGATITAGWERWTLYLDDGDDLEAIVDSLERAGNEVALVRDVALETIENRQQLELSRVLYENLTSRQREVLKTAIDFGYYRHKRETSIEVIAERVGIAPTTAWEHLSRAEAKVMAEISTILVMNKR